MKQFRVNNTSSNQKIEKFVRHSLAEAPISFIYKLFRKKDIKVNGHWVDKNFVLKEGDIVTVYATDQQLSDFAKKSNSIVKKDFEHEIIYEDKNILIVNKPKGLLVFGDDKGSTNTLSNDVLSYLYNKGEYNPNDASFTPSPAHRLDRNTSGLVIYGKNETSLSLLTELFKDRTEITKRYVALVLGQVDKEGTINKPLRKNPETSLVTVCPLSKGGKTAITNYKVIKRFTDYSLVDVELVTGRTHQIRVHFASIDHPIVGDSKYGNFEDCKLINKMFKLDSQFLHAKEIEFGNLKEPLSYLSNKKFEGKLPSNLNNILKNIH